MWDDLGSNDCWPGKGGVKAAEDNLVGTAVTYGREGTLSTPAEV